MKEISCNCGHSFEADLPESFDLDRDPNQLPLILAGDFMTVKCPNCDHLLKPDIPFRIQQKSRDLDVFYIPEPDRRKYLKEELGYSIEGAQRVVIGYRELVEKLKLLTDGLDERVVEVLKYYLLIPALEATEEEAELRILYQEREQGNLKFFIEGLKKDEIGVSRIPYETYEKAVQRLEETIEQEPFDTLLAPPYISINKVYLEE